MVTRPRQLAQLTRRPDVARRDRAEVPRPALSPRQEQVLLLLGAGLGLGEIAARLGISEWTVRTYRDEARGRLDARTTAQAVAIVVRRAAAR